MAHARPRSESARRARGFSVGENSKILPIKRWDGLSRTCRDWDNLRRDPEIWERNGNCLVHLYGKGESKRGPSFKLPFASLISTGCFPLIEKFLVLDGLDATSREEIENWDRQHPRSTVELYIPTPPAATEQQALRYQLAIRNLLAWILGRPMVGEQLGPALLGLRHSMRELRLPRDDNVEELMTYIREAGYLHMDEEPSFALAILHVAETYRMEELYTRAFAHCVGMYPNLPLCPEYQIISSASRRLIKKARIQMNAHLLQTSDMLRGFLDDELSESHLAIPSGTRAHLERFRSFLLSFYSTKFGYYPPKTFGAGVLRTMARDFEALYNLLVDFDYAGSVTMPAGHVGGICTLQLVQAFDERHKLDPLENQLPRLPQVEVPSSMKLVSWLSRGEKAVSSQRQVTHAALIKASNWTDDIFKNGLVRAYRKFEEQSIIAPNRIDKNEKVSVLDARKVRWIMIYAIHQILRRMTTQPAAAQNDKATYHLAVSTEGIPPWKHKIVAGDLGQNEAIELNLEDGPTIRWGEESRTNSFGIGSEIKPDVDYFALTHKDPNDLRDHRRSNSMNQTPDHGSPEMSRSSSFSISLRRNSTIRRSLRRFRASSHSETQQSVGVIPKSAYHEIVVQGYGNGTQDVTVEAEDVLMMKGMGNLTSRSDSTSSSQSNQSKSTASGQSTLDSISSTVDTLPSMVLTPDTMSPTSDTSMEMEMSLAGWGPQDKAPARSLAMRSASMPVGGDMVSHSIPEVENYPKGTERKVLTKKKRLSFEPTSSTLMPLNAPRRYSMIPDLRKRYSEFEEKSAPVQILEDEDAEEPWGLRKRSSDEWSTMQAFMDGTRPKAEAGDAWSQYADLGGFTDMS